jgi:hypothetical protein
MQDLNEPEDLHKLIERAEKRAYLAWARQREEKRNSGAGKGQKRPLREQDIQRNIAGALEKLGFLVVRINSSTMEAESGTRLSSYRITNLNATAGHSDLVVYKGGRAWFLEVKRPESRNRLSESQVRFRDACQRYGMEYHVVTSPEEAVNALQGKEVTP